MTNWKCTTESDILEKYAKQFQSNSVKVKTIIKPNDNAGTPGLFQVSIPNSTFQESGSCVPISIVNAQQNLLKTKLMEKTQRLITQSNLLQAERWKQYHIIPYSPTQKLIGTVPEKQTTHKIPTVNDIIPSETNPIIKFTTEPIPQPTTELTNTSSEKTTTTSANIPTSTKSNIFTFTENIISKYKYYILIVIAILIILILIIKKK